MSLLDSALPAHAPAVTQLARDLEAGSLQDRAVLLNMREEGRLPPDTRQAFHSALARSTKARAIERLWEACPAGHLALPVDKPRPDAIQGRWWTYMTITKLRRLDFIGDADPLASAPPPRARLVRPYGRGSNGVDYPFWISSCGSTDADDVRDRLGLCHVADGEELYRVPVAMDVSPDRDLHVPSALDSNAHPAWRCPPPGHVAPWGMTRDLRTDAASEPEILAHPHTSDGNRAEYVGRTHRPPSEDYLRARLR